MWGNKVIKNLWLIFFSFLSSLLKGNNTDFFTIGAGSLTAAGDGNNGVYLPYIKYIAANATYGKSNPTYIYDRLLTKSVS